MNLNYLFPIVSAIFVSCKEPLQSDTLNIIPKPVEVHLNKGVFALNDSVKIYYSHDTLANDAAAVAKKLNIEVGGFAENPPTFCIFLKPLSSEKREAYNLTVTPQGIVIEATDRSGAYYAALTISQLPKPIQAMELTDYPRFEWRGMHLDCSRHFFSAEEVKRYIDLLAMHKLNRFHWHLTDDQGWRLESKKYPLLTEISAWRADRSGEEWNGRAPRREGEPTTYGGFYSSEEIKEIVRYAQERCVMIIPEIEVPGHSSEVFAAYPELSCTGKRQEVTIGGYYPETMTRNYCAGKDSVFTFLEGVFDEVLELFPNAEYIHIGGDEVNKSFWKKCPHCAQRMKEENLKDYDELQSYFIRRIAEYINSKGREVIGWDEILKGGLHSSTSVMSWRGVSGGIQAAKSGHKVVMTPSSHLYFDFYQNNPLVEPKSIGGLITTRKVYDYEPVPSKLTSEEATYIMGVQANLWAEYISTYEAVESMVLPRMSALAEVAWSPKEGRHWDDFSKRLATQQQRYKELGLNAHTGADFVEFDAEYNKMEKAFTVKMCSQRYGTDIFYTTDGSQPTLQSAKYVNPIEITSVANIVALLAKDGKIISKMPTEYLVGVHKGVGKKIKYNCKVSPSYAGKGTTTLIDGLTGYIDNSDPHMQGICAMNFDVEIDLLVKEEINKISLSCLQSVGKWIYLPTELILYTSEDGVKWQEVAKESVDSSKTGYQDKKTISLTKKITTRFLRVVAVNGVTPEGLPGAGKINWLFLDELFIQ